VFLIYGIGASGEATPAGSESPERYGEMVTEAVIADLAARLGVSVDAVRVVTRDYVEVQIASPCGVTTEAMGGGLGLGYEVVLEVGTPQYRYVVMGGLAYYCGEQ